MAGKKTGENTKKAAGQARKAEAAAGKKAAADAKVAAEEEKKWAKGSKDTSKKQEAENKKAEAARKKAERDALLAAEEASQPSKPKGAGAKSAQKKGATTTTNGSRGTLDLSQLDEEPAKPRTSTLQALHASGIDNALDALSLTEKDRSKVERHPERRFKAAYRDFEARRLPELEKEYPGLRRNQRVELCRKEFEKSEENPFNQAHVAFDATFEEEEAMKSLKRKEIESRLVHSDSE